MKNIKVWGFGVTYIRDFTTFQSPLCRWPRVSAGTVMIKLEQLERLRSEIPPAAPWLPIRVIHTRSQVKRRQSQSYKFKKIAKNSNFEILQAMLNATHLKLLDDMYKYEIDPTRTVGTTERTQDVGRMDRRTDGRTEWNQYTPQQLVGGYNKRLIFMQHRYLNDWHQYTHPHWRER